MHHNAIIETIWFVIPIIIVAALAIPTVKTLYDYEKPRRVRKINGCICSKCRIQMVLCLSDEHIETVNTLTIPKDRPVVFKLQAMDTMTSFWIPQLGGQKICHDWHDNELDVRSISNWYVQRS